VLDPRNNFHAFTRTITIFVSIIDFVVSAVVEQVYGSTFKLCLLKIQEICPLKRFIFTSKCTIMRLVVGLHSELLGELTALPRALAELRGGSGKGEGRRGKGREEGGEKGKGRTHNVTLKCVDANEL